MSVHHFRLFASLTLSAIVLTGCGSSDEPRIAVHPVSGKISVGGEAPVGAQIVLHQAGAAQERKFAPTAKVAKDGTFKITSYKSGDGAPEGEYVATVAWYKITDAGVRGDDVVPKQYSSAETSPLKISVKAGANELPPIEIPKS